MDWFLYSTSVHKHSKRLGVVVSPRIAASAFRLPPLNEDRICSQVIWVGEQVLTVVWHKSPSNSLAFLESLKRLLKLLHLITLLSYWETLTLI